MSFKDRLKKAPDRNLQTSDISLKGSGITKRMAERQERAIEREENRSIEKGQETASREAAQKFQSALDETMASIAADAALKNIKLDASQLTAMRGILKNKVSILMGAAGTGKTTLERMIIEQLIKKVHTVRIDLRKDDPEDEDAEETETQETPGIALAAPTGRAAQQSRRAIGEGVIPISTVHSLLGYAPTEVEVDAYDEITKSWYKKAKRMFKPTFNAALKLPYTVYILDEVSMLMIPLWNEFVDAIHETSRILLVGDLNQLPPIYGKSVLGYALNKWPKFELTTIHRQAAGSAIIMNSQRVLQGQIPLDAKGFTLIKSNAEGSVDFSMFIRQVIELMAKKGKFDPYKDVLIVPNSNPEIITSAPVLNEHFVTLFNPEKKDERGVIINKRMFIHTGTGEAFFAVGDKVMINQNINTVNPPITNGMMGVVESINLNGKYKQEKAAFGAGTVEDEVESISLDALTTRFQLEADIKDDKEDKEDESLDQRQSSHVMTIRFDTQQTFTASTAGDFRKISFGYAITCHKAQGGEFPTVFIAIHSANGALLSREWLYTAITRARGNVYLIYNQRGLERALKTQKIKGNTLDEKVRSYILETQSNDMPATDPWNVDRTKFPILFNPEEVE